MFKKILVAIDRSNLTPVVFEQAVDLAAKDKAALMIFHCFVEEMLEPLMESRTGLDFYPSDVGAINPYETEIIQKEIEGIEQWLQSYHKKAEDRGVLAQYDQKSGNPDSAICQIAKEWGADLIVVGRKHHNQLTELFTGSVSNYVIHHAHCSVLVVKES
ncbi:MAG: universal stress protein [Rivularia sp. (in: Bacteria)]|nr:universal stress protein [Rivularia sp. MS3]